MSEPAASGRPTGGGRTSTTVRRGYEPYNPASRAASNRDTIAPSGGAAGTAGTASRGRVIWEDDSEPARLPKGEKEWKHDLWDRQQDRTTGGVGSSSTNGSSGRRRSAATGAGVRGRGGTAGAPKPPTVEPQVPSGEQYEDLSRRVEDEVVAKLARAQMMGMMLKAHREHEQASVERGRRGGGSSRRDGGGGSGGSGRRARGGGSDAAGPRHIQRRADAGRASGPGAGRIGGSGQAPDLGTVAAGGHEAYENASAQGRDTVAASAVPGARGRGVIRTAGVASQAAGLLRVSSEKLMVGAPPGAVAASGDAAATIEDLGADPETMDVEDVYTMVGKIEHRHKAYMEDLRKELGIAVPGRVEAASGPAAVAAASAAAAASRARDGSGSSMHRMVARIRGALVRALGSLIRRDPALSLRKRLPNRLWMAHYRELDVVQQRLRQLGSDATDRAPQKRKQWQLLRARLFVLIEDAERDIGGMAERMEKQIAAADLAKPAPLHQGSSRGATSLADDESHVCPSDDTAGDDVDSSDGGQAGSDSDSDGGDEEFSLEELGRRHALQAFVTSLGDLARYRGVYTDSVAGASGSSGGDQAKSWARAEELYLRARRIDPVSGKVWNQMAVLASCRQDNLEAFYAYLRGLCSAAPYPGARESLLLLHEKCKARLSTLKEATALDALGLAEHQARFRLYLLGACGTCLSRVDLGTFDGYLALSERHMVSCVQLYLMRPEAERATLVDGEGLDGTLARAIILCVCTASASFEAWRARDMEGGSWTTDAATSRAVRLCLSLAGALAGLHRRTSKRGWERTTAAAVGVFLDWLVCRPQFGEGARGTGLEEFQRVMACIVEFANGVIRSASSGASGGNAFSTAQQKRDNGAEPRVDPDAPLWEDEECRGLPALGIVTERRAAKAKKQARLAAQCELSHPSPTTTAPLQKEREDRTAVAAHARGGGRRGGGGGGRGGGRGRSRRRPRSKSWANESNGSSTSAEIAGNDPWKIRVARIRHQVEFCVERGWIARGNRPGTYTLSKPPSRHGSPREDDDPLADRHSSIGPAGGDVGFAVDEQQGVTTRGHSGGGGGTLWVADDEPTAGRRGGRARSGRGGAVLGAVVPSAQDQGEDGRIEAGGVAVHGRPGGRQPRVPLIAPGLSEKADQRPLSPSASPSPSSPRLSPTRAPGSSQHVADGGTFAGLPPPPQGHMSSAAAVDAAAVAEALSTMHLEMQADETRAVHGLRVDEVALAAGLPELDAGGPSAELQRGPSLRGEPAPRALAPLEMAGVTVAAQRQEATPAVVSAPANDNPLPESLLGIVLAGLGSAEENICAYCCATVPPNITECTNCGAPAPPAAAQQQQQLIAPEGVLGPPDTSAAMPVPSQGFVTDVAGDAEAEQKRSIAPETQAMASKALPAGVLAVDNLAEVIASSQRPELPVVGKAAGGQHGSARARACEARNPSSIARAGLGDGSGGGGGRGGAGRGSGVSLGGKMFGWPRGAPRASALPLVVIDIPNVAMRHGLNKKFSCTGVQMAIEYFRTAGHRVLGFLPDYYLDEKRTNGLERAKKLGVAEVKASRLPDDVQLLQRFVDDGVIVATPPQDYDDSYCIKYAMAREGYLVTNDLYRDHIKGIDGRKKAEAARRWIKSHSISYTFVGDEFFPNPDFSFQQDQPGGGGAA